MSIKHACVHAHAHAHAQALRRSFSAVQDAVRRQDLAYTHTGAPAPAPHTPPGAARADAVRLSDEVPWPDALPLPDEALLPWAMKASSLLAGCGRPRRKP